MALAQSTGAMGDVGGLRTRRDWWPVALGGLHVANTLWFGSMYPDLVYDPDLVAYFVYFRNWLTGTTALHDAAYFTVPKPLLVFLLGPLDSAQAAFAVSAVAAGVFGALVYLIGRNVFDRTVGIVCSLMLLVDIDRATLTSRASADFFLALFLFASIHAALVRRYLWAGVAIALAALVKPVALPCVVHLLAVDGEDRRRAWVGAAIAVVALPLIAVANQALLGSPFGSQRFFAGFASMSDGAQMPTGDLLRFILWVELVKTIFVATAPFGVAGMVVWIGRDRRRLTNPFFVAPLALAAGYVVLSLTTPFIAFARFFWPIQVWFGCFIVYGMVETARRLAPEPRAFRVAVAGVLLFFLFDEQTGRQLHYRSHFAAPFQDAMTFVETTDGLLASARATGDTILTPVAFFPYLLWTIDDAREHPSLVRVAEYPSDDAAQAPPDWVLYVPGVYIRKETRARVEALLSSGLYQPILAGEGNVGALYLRRDRNALARVEPSR
jgi:hypothetical protein